MRHSIRNKRNNGHTIFTMFRRFEIRILYFGRREQSRFCKYDFIYKSHGEKNRKNDVSNKRRQTEFCSLSYSHK